MSTPTRKNLAIEALTKEMTIAKGLGCDLLAKRCQEAIDQIRQASRKGARGNSTKRSRGRK